MTDGAPALDGCDYFVGRVLETLETDGDHRGYVLEPEAVTGARRPVAAGPPAGRGPRAGPPRLTGPDTEPAIPLSHGPDRCSGFGRLVPG